MNLHTIVLKKKSKFFINLGSIYYRLINKLQVIYVISFDDPAQTLSTFYLDDKTLRFVQEHSLMSDSVLSVNNQPLLFMSQIQTRFTAVAVETNILDSNGSDITILYVGTENGKLLKVTVGPNYPKSSDEVVFNEEWEVYRPGICSSKTDSENTLKAVKEITLIPGTDFVLVVFQHCLMSVPKKACWHYTCKK